MPETKAEHPHDDDSDDDAQTSQEREFEQTLMWVHQTNWQREMLSKYGNTMTLIDATYKTTLYDLALFFITVRTNAGYIVAAEFIIQTGTNEQIGEALSIQNHGILIGLRGILCLTIVKQKYWL